MSGSCLGGARADFFSFFTSALVFCSAVKTFGFGFGPGFAFGFAFAFALGFGPDFALGFGPGFALVFGPGFALGFVVLVAFFAVAAPAAGRAFFLGLLVALPVCALGLEAGLVAKDRDVNELPLLPMCVFWHATNIEYDFATRSGFVGVKATRFAVKAATVDCGRRTNVRTIGKIMANAFAYEMDVSWERWQS